MTIPFDFAVQLCKRIIFAGVIVTILGFLVNCRTLPIDATNDQIRVKILTVTPLGMSLREARLLIQERIRPDAIYVDENLPGLMSKTAGKTEGKPLPLEHCTVIACELGKTHGWPLPFLAVTYTQIEGHWVFDSSGHLIEVEVARNPRGM